MAVPRMHVDEVSVDLDLVHRLITRDLPGLSALPLTRLDTFGTDHVVVGIGDELAIHLPKIGWAVGQGEREARWLPTLAPYLPVQVASPIHVGQPASDHPSPGT